jgi:Rapamycin-insensitive companion of mTOR, N-term
MIFFCSSVLLLLLVLTLPHILPSSSPPTHPHTHTHAYSQDIVLDAFFLILRVNIPLVGVDPFRSSKNTTDGSEEAVDARPDLPSRHKRHDLLDNFTTAVCLALIHCGLPEALIYLGHEMRTATTTNVSALEERKLHIATKATVLLGEILSLSNSLLPPSVCARLQVGGMRCRWCACE